MNDRPPLETYDLRTEYRVEPLGIDSRRPRFSWRLRGARRGAAQTHFFIQVFAVSPIPGVAESLVWTSGWARSADSFGHELGDISLQSSTRYRWVLTLRDDLGREVDGGESWFETALLSRNDFIGAWISRDPSKWDMTAKAPSNETPSLATRRLPPARFLRGPFETKPKQIVRARLYVSAHGLYLPFLNGERIGDHELAPGWTDYHDRVMYQTFDVTSTVLDGANALGVVICDGWWSGFYGSDRRGQGYHYGRAPEAWAQLLVDYADGERQVIATDRTWSDSDGEVLYGDLLMGERIDARRSIGQWTSPSHDASDWAPVSTRDISDNTLCAMVDEPIREMERLQAKSVRAVGDGWILDFGQNISGRMRLELPPEEAGTKVQIRFAEMLDANGHLYTENLRTAEATDVYTCSGEPGEVFEPHFTSHGFQFAEITGLHSAPEPASATAIVLRNDIPWVGTFESSDHDLNQLQQNITWGQRDNYVAVPTDCPQRDERLGWLADAQVFFRTSVYNADVASFYTRWLHDVRYAQAEDGGFSNVAPKITIVSDGAPAWGDAGVIIPWEMYRMYGDRQLLADSFESMRRWVDYIHGSNRDLIWRNRVGANYGDWLEIDAETRRDVLATAYFANSARIVARAAEVLRLTAEGGYYSDLAERIGDSFVDEFVSPDGTIDGDTQTSYLLALEFELGPDLRDRFAEKLVQNIEEHGFSLTTGFVGVGLLCPILTKIGRSDLAYRLALEDSYPSWLYSVRQGATTIWERWDGWTSENGFQSPRMNSFNHYALGSIGEWFYRDIAGIDQLPHSVAFDRLAVRPQIGGGLTWAQATFETPRGRVNSRWSREADSVLFTLEIPPGSSAAVTLPFAPGAEVRERDTVLSEAVGVSEVLESIGSIAMHVTSGTYEFVVSGVGGELLAMP